MPTRSILMVRECSAILEQASQSFPADMKYGTVVSNARFVRESLIEVAKTFLKRYYWLCSSYSFFCSPGARHADSDAGGTGIVAGHFPVRLLMGFSINTLTLFAMVLAIGLVVDDAIVVVEAVEYHMRFNGLPPREATYKAMEDVSGPIVAIAFVLASVFIPVAFFGGTVGVLYKQFARPSPYPWHCLPW